MNNLIASHIHRFRSLLKRVILILLFLSVGLYSQSQTLRSFIVPDSLQMRSPMKAALYSSVLPGLGQAYNKKYWKIPIIYGGMIGLGYAVNKYNHEYIDSKNAYSDLVNNNFSSSVLLEVVSRIGLDNQDISASTKSSYLTAVKLEKDETRRDRDFNAILITAIYLLNIVDASVDAHFFDFDVSKDLSLRVEPLLIDYTSYHNMYGLRCYLHF